VTSLARSLALCAGIALSAYPAALAPAWPTAVVGGGLALVCLALTLFAGSRIAAIAALCVWALEYAVALLAGDTVLDPFAALFGAVWLLVAEVLFALSGGPPRPSPEQERRRLVYGICIAFVACVAASATEVAGAITPTGGLWAPLLAVACAIGALLLLGALAARALGLGTGVGSRRP
jgi:hypothetical protein